MVSKLFSIFTSFNKKGFWSALVAIKIDDVGNLQDFKYIGRVYVSLVESVKVFQNFFL